MKVSVELADWQAQQDDNTRLRTLVTELRRQVREYKAALSYSNETMRLLVGRLPEREEPHA